MCLCGILLNGGAIVLTGVFFKRWHWNFFNELIQGLPKNSTHPFHVDGLVQDCYRTGVTAVRQVKS